MTDKSDLEKAKTELQRSAAAEREQLLAAEYEQRLLAETLTEVTLALTSHIHHAAVLDEILRQVQRLVPYRTAHIMLLEGETLRIARWKGYQSSEGQEHVANLVQPLAELPVDSKIIQSQQPLVISDTRDVSHWVVSEATAWVRSFIGVPITLHHQVIGLLRLDSDTPGDFTPEDAERLQPLANAAAVALKNARLFEQAEKEIAERKQAEKTLRFQARLLDSVREAVIATDLKGRIIYWGKGAETLYGYLSDEVVGKSVIPFFDTDRNRVRGVIDQILKTGWWQGQHTQQRNDGGRFWADTVVSAVEDQEGQPTGLIGIVRDISDRREAEERIKNHNLLLEQAVDEKTKEMELMTERLVRQEKLAAIGRISSSIAHELRNPLGAIRQSIFYLNRLCLQDKMESSRPKVHEYLALIERELETTNRVITDLLEMTRLQPVRLEKIGLESIILEAFERAQLADQVQLQLDLDPAVCQIEADPLQLRQVFINLLTNAAQAGGADDTVTVNSRFLSKENQYQIEIQDHGQGIELEAINKVFEPLYTGRASGTGLGLTICKQIIENHGGSIVLNSKVDQGTTVSIQLPHQIDSEDL